jgi:hypothetical protein
VDGTDRVQMLHATSNTDGHMPEDRPRVHHFSVVNDVEELASRCELHEQCERVYTKSNAANKVWMVDFAVMIVFRA